MNDKARPNSRAAALRKGGAISPYVYAFRPDGGRVRGFQVRFKRTLGKGVESLSRYFSVSSFGSADAAKKAALEWRDSNFQWLTDRRFAPKRRRRSARQQVADRIARRARRVPRARVGSFESTQT